MTTQLTDLTNLINVLAAISVSDLKRLLESAGPVRARALTVAANLNEAVLGERFPNPNAKFGV